MSPQIVRAGFPTAARVATAALAIVWVCLVLAPIGIMIALLAIETIGGRNRTHLAIAMA